MSFQPGANLYSQGFGSRAENIEVPHIEQRNPGPFDINFPVGKRWINTVAEQESILYSFSIVNGVTVANWSSSIGPSGAVDTLSNGVTKVSPDGTGNIAIDGTTNQLVVTSNPGSNNLTLTLSSPVITPGSLEVTGGFEADAGAFIHGAAVDIETGTNPLTINTTSTGNISIGQTGGAQATNLSAGSGGVVVNTVGAIDVESGTSAFTLNTTSTGDISIGQSTGAQTTTILGASGGVNIDSAAGSTIKIANTLSTNAGIDIGNSNTSAINIGSQAIALFTYGSGIDINTFGGGQIGINNAVIADTTIGLSGAGVSTTSILAADSGFINIGNTGNTDIQIGNVIGIGTTVIDAGSGGVLILNSAGNSQSLSVGPVLPNGTSGNIVFNSGDTGGSIFLNGGTVVRSQNTLTSNYTATVSDYFLPCDTTGGVFTVTLPAIPHGGQHIVVSDVTGSATINNITINGNGHNVNGSPTFAISMAFGRADLYFNGTVWSA